MSVQKKQANQPGLARRLLTPIPAELRSEFESRRLRTNVDRMFAFSFYVIILQIVLNAINIMRPAEGQPDNIMIYVGLSMGTLLLGIIYAVLFALVRRGKIKNAKLQSFLVYSLLYCYLAIQLTFCTLNIMANGGVNSYIIAILIVGMVPIISPIQSLLTIVGAFAYTMLAMFMTRHISEAWATTLGSDLWTNLIIISGFTCFISICIFDMFKSNQLQSLTLESTVRQRTLELEEKSLAAQAASHAKSDFLARMSHELRTPLNAIMGMTQVARKNQDPARIEDSLNAISDASNLLLGILNDILDMSKIESGALSFDDDRFQICQTLREVAQIINLRCINNSLQFISNISQVPEVEVIGDKLRLKQALLNILGNAVKFTPEGGRVEFKVTVGQQTSIDLTLHVAISDTGIGMAEEKKASIFEPFAQNEIKFSARYGGSGLGLAISKSIIMNFGGSITVESAPQQGSTFRFPLRLPLAPQQAETPGQICQISSFSGKRILIVEDIEINRLILKGLLEDTGLLMDEAVDGVEAINIFSASPEGYYDLLCMDIQMPNMDGYEATRGIRALERSDAARVPILAMTANAYKEDVEQAMAAGMNEHLAKPLDVDLVLNALHRYLSKNEEFTV